ncbi:uncharacterized protein [Prorops nasuta]|uniref:uncharacterized protein n=1 Tax=Prorops nasuta TaxID=863751 RepID=UPI0034CF6A6B
MMQEYAEEDELLTETALLILLLGAYILKRRNISLRWVNREYWVRPINVLRRHQGNFHNLFQEMKNDPSLFFRCTRMTPSIFYKLLEQVKPLLTKRNYRALISEQRLVLSLRYLATGDQILSIALTYRIGESTARQVIIETCTAIIKVLGPIYLRPPSDEEWIKICEGFYSKWNLPNCCGAIDGKHIQIQAPPNSGSLYFNYKKTFSIILMAACDYNYKFILVDCGEYGSSSDGGVLSRSMIGQALKNHSLNIPAGEFYLPGSTIKTPIYFVGDEAFQLTTNMMRPYSGRNLNFKKRIFNYRLSRARRIIENSFGILVSRWRILRKPIMLHPKNVDKIVVSLLCLHNFLQTVNEDNSSEENCYCPPNFVDSEREDGSLHYGAWRQEYSANLNSAMEGIRASTAHRSTTAAHKQRDDIADYLISPAGGVVADKNVKVSPSLLF